MVWSVRYDPTKKAIDYTSCLKFQFRTSTSQERIKCKIKKKKVREILFVQEVLTHLNSKLLYEMGQDVVGI